MKQSILNKIKPGIVQNCNISDSIYAGNYTLCIYLLKMREYYRWEKQIPFGTRLSNDDIGDWLIAREAHWDEIEELPYEPVGLTDDISFNCFNTDKIIDTLVPEKLIYSAGYGNYGKPVFFLADLESQTSVDDYTIYVCGHEYARELAAPPGMSADRKIFIRKESLKRFIWEKVEESSWYSKDNPLARALAYYDFNSAADSSLEQMSSLETDTVLHHEIGEIRSDQLLGDQWNNMLMQLPRSQAEFMLRAIKDHMADAISTLPRMVENNDPAQIHFYFANLSGMRREIFPGLMDIYQKWKSSKNKQVLQDITAYSLDHWHQLALKVLKAFEKDGLGGLANLELLVKKNYLQASV